MHYPSLPQHPDALPATADVLLKGQPLSQIHQAEAIARAARRHARELLREATKEARDFHFRAAQAGYEAGFLEALNVALHYLHECRRAHLQMRDQIAADVHEALTAVLEDPRLQMRLARALAERRSETERTLVRVTLPNGARRVAAIVRKRVAKVWPGAEVIYADTRAYLVEWGDQVIEFDPERCATQLSSAALAACDDTISAIDTNALVRSILEQTVNSLKMEADACVDAQWSMNKEIQE
jgi:hypothetical protein